MAKTTTGRATPAKMKAAPPAAAKKPKTVAPAKKAALPKATPAAEKKAAPAMAAPPKKKAVTAKAPVTAKTPAPKAAAPVRPAPKNPAPTKVAKAPQKAAAPAKAVVPKKAAAPKVAAKTVAVKKAAPRRAATRVAVPTPSARRGRPTPSVRKTPAKKLTGGGPQVFTVSHLNEADFKADGLRPYAQYRDLGIAAATAGLCQAHVIRLVPPCTDEVRKRHVHQAELQLVYVLKGWMKNEFEGHGEQMMSVGSCWLQPTGIKHTVLDYSADCEVLEIIVPADFKTEELA